MTHDFQPPITVDGVKRLANRLRRQQGLQHARALDRAAEIAGFNNYTDALNRLRATATVTAPTALLPRGVEILVSIGWRDRPTRASGMETVAVRLTGEWDALLAPSLLRKAPRLGHMRRVGERHLGARTLTDTQEAARREACQAARTLQFMDATGLRPSVSRARVYPNGDYGKAVPGMDHATTWYDPGAGAHVLADEPYRSGENRAAERAAWARRHGFGLVRSAGWGMYYPDGGCELYLIADAAKGYDAAPLVAALDALGTPLSQSPWSGVSQALDLDLLWSERPRA